MVMANETDLAKARELTTLAARWLALLRFRVHSAAPSFSPSVSHYHDMLDPYAEDSVRLSACRNMRAHVWRRAQAEKEKGEERHLRDRPADPYRLEWRTTETGAAMELIADILSEAIRNYEDGIEKAVD